MPTTRRQFIQTAAGAASLGLGDMPLLGALAAFGAEPPPDTVRFGPDIEPIVRLMEETPRERCVSVFVDQLRRGLPYDRFLAATLFAGIRRQHSNHEVYKIHSVHQVSMDVRPEERLLPLFWAVDVYKKHQQDFPRAALTELTGPFPAPERAAAEFLEAMQQSDLGRSEHALVALAREQGARPTIERLWLYGCRNGSLGGHAAIVVANCFRALDAIGWQHAEPGLRFILQDLYFSGWVKPDRYFQPNLARVNQHLAALPARWTADKSEVGATRELLALLREGQADAACELAIKQLAGGVAASSLWNAIHLGAAELMVRHNDGWGLASRPLHCNTSTNALHYAFRTCANPGTRLLVLLQAVAWTADKTRGDLALNTLRDIQITHLPSAQLPASSEEAVAEIFSLLPPRSYSWDAKNKKAVLVYGKREDADLASRKAFTLTNERPEAIPLFLQAARSWLCRKANGDAHEYKFLAAILENAAWVSPPWRPRLLAASVHYFHGNQTPDNPALQQARDALKAAG